MQSKFEIKLKLYIQNKQNKTYNFKSQIKQKYKTNWHEFEKNLIYIFYGNESKLYED